MQSARFFVAISVGVLFALALIFTSANFVPSLQPAIPRTISGSSTITSTSSSTASEAISTASFQVTLTPPTNLNGQIALNNTASSLQSSTSTVGLALNAGLLGLVFQYSVVALPVLLALAVGVVVYRLSKPKEATEHGP